MNGTTLNSALLSLNKNLSHPGLLVDNRTEQEYLNFVTGFSRLINFFNKSNVKDGSWESFLLKDPVFLLASISQIDAADQSKLFKNAYTQCLGNADNIKDNDLGSLNPLFNQIFTVFDNLLNWSTCMYNGDQDYGLKTAVIGNVQTQFATLFWAFSDLRNELALSPEFTGLVNVDQGFTYQYETNLWGSAEYRKPYQKVLGLTKPLNENTFEDLVNVLKEDGTKVFLFHQNVVKNQILNIKSCQLKKQAIRTPCYCAHFFSF